MGIKSVALSNSVEILLEHLKANLFSEGVGVFSEKILITPSSGMQQWIHVQLASSLGVASGLSTVFLDKGMAKVREHVFLSRIQKPLPTRLELFLEIEAQLTDALTVAADDPIWTPLINYVQGKERRKTALTLYLTQVFERYGTCGGKAALDWQQKPTNWQEALWAKVFSRWDYPQRALQELKVKENIPMDMSVHLFAFSYIPPLYFHFFCQTPQQVPIYVYQLSPCKEFWSDMPSDYPSLLGSMGKMGRSMARMIEESNVTTVENYIAFGGETQLKRLQRDLLHMQSTETCLDDLSIQVHTISTRREEIATLHNYLLELADKDGILPADIVVMAPNIALYAPYIQAIFGKHLDYQIADMPSQKGSPVIEGLFLVLNLEKKRWSSTAVLELFEHALFRKKWNFTDDDLALIREWIRKTGIRWAVDGAHRAHLLMSCQESSESIALEEGATWMEGLGHLIEELAMLYEPTRIDFSQAETLGKTVQLITTLYKDTRELENKKTLSEWVHFFKKLFHDYFLGGDIEPLLALFEEIEKAYAFFPSTLYAYPFVSTVLQEWAVQKSVTIHHSQLQAVRFCSMLPMRAIPAKIICLIGLDHDAFPRKEQLQALDLLGKHPQCGYSPSRLDFDRSLFLEALLSAREKLYISYLGQDPYDLSECPTSSVVAHLMPMISKKQIFKHSAHLMEGSISTPIIRIHEPTILPQGEFEITISEFARFSRSFLDHYLQGQGFRVYEEEIIQDEEAFLLTPSRRAQLRQKALGEPFQNVEFRVKREGDFPIGSFGKLARLQLHEEITTLPKRMLNQIEIEPMELIVNPSLLVTFTGSIENVFSEGMCVQGKKDFRTAAKAWPLFLLLNAYDSSKSQLLFAASDQVRSSFFDDPKSHLKNLVELFFYARAHPLLLAVEWIEPILQQDPKKLAQAEHYDRYLRWYLLGKGPIDPEHWIETYYPMINKVYGEMSHAWF